MESKTKQLIEDEKKLNNSYKAKLVLANENIEKLRIENERYSEIVQELRKDYEKLNEKWETSQNSSQNTEKIFSRKISELEANFIISEDDYKARVLEKEKKIESLNTEILQFLSKNEEILKENNKLKDQANISIKENNLLKSELHAKNGIILEISNQNKDLSTQIQSLAEVIESEKIKSAKEITQLIQTHEKLLTSTINELKSEHYAEISKKTSEYQELNQTYLECLSFAKFKEEENKSINNDREKLQNMIRELEKKFRELINKISKDSQESELIQTQYKEEKQIRLLLENKYNSLLIKFKDLEENYENEVCSLNETIKANKIDYKEQKIKNHRILEEKIKAEKDVVCYWKEKFREEVGYLEKWAESVEGDANALLVHGRITNIIKRLMDALDYSFYNEVV